MREILFRGKHINSKKWLYGDLLQMDNGECQIVALNSDRSGYVEPETVGQYTRLRDKNGKRIFEGDLYKSDSDYILEVVYLEKEACFAGVFVEYPEEWFFLEDIVEMEKVGNKHDNPELLRNK